MSVESVRSAFLQQFGLEPQVIGIAPGRVNLIGEHTDYNDGFVFPAAIDRGMLIAASVTDGPSEVFSVQLGQGESFDVQTAQPRFTESWSKYVAGTGWALAGFVNKQLPNLKIVLDSRIPIGSGVSSSAALELACGVVWNKLCHLGLDNPRLALLGQLAENQFVGVNCGIMDQMASAMGKEGSAIFLDTRSLQIKYAPVPSNLSVVLCDTTKERALTTSAYNERRSQCEAASEAMGVSKLRDADVSMLESSRELLSNVVYRRAKHVITENARCLEFIEALSTGDLESVGHLMKASHVSLRDDYEVSCSELDAMAEAAWSAPGCVGARMTGAGFGGACVALVETAQLRSFVEVTLNAYKTQSGLTGKCMDCKVVEGARILEG